MLSYKWNFTLDRSIGSTGNELNSRFNGPCRIRATTAKKHAERFCILSETSLAKRAALFSMDETTHGNRANENSSGKRKKQRERKRDRLSGCGSIRSHSSHRFDENKKKKRKSPNNRVKKKNIKGKERERVDDAVSLPFPWKLSTSRVGSLSKPGFELLDNSIRVLLVTG